MRKGAGDSAKSHLAGEKSVVREEMSWDVKSSGSPELNFKELEASAKIFAAESHFSKMPDGYVFKMYYCIIIHV